MPYHERMLKKATALAGKTPLRVLAMESSCDDTSAAVVEDGRRVLSNVIDSQVMEHRKYGGVVPEIAARRHLESIDDVVDEALRQAGCTLDDMDAIAVTKGPGLVGALLAGVSCAKALAFGRDLPLAGVHHIAGHIAAAYLADRQWQPPFIALVVSGGHSHVARVDDYIKITWLARTRDDAAGEAFDKVARVLGLPYPGGPFIDALAKQGNPAAIAFPRARVSDAPLDFSFSGLKTAVVSYVQRLSETELNRQRADIAASFQQAVVDVLAGHTMQIVDKTGIKKVAAVGGVACNSALRAALETACSGRGVALCIPEAVLCTDNAAMIASAGYYNLQAGRVDSLGLNAAAVLSIEEE